ncbi:MAG: ABC transporter permease [Chloroflexota bacterium]
MELRKTLWSRRSWWIYLLALLPLALITMYGVQVHMQAEQRAAWMARGQQPLTDAAFSGISGLTLAQLEQRLGPPAEQSQRVTRRHVYHYLRYATPDAMYNLGLTDGKLTGWSRHDEPGFTSSGRVFASIYEFFTLRLVVFFACLGLFMRLFRGELMDRSLHFYFLAPVRREIVLAGKFLAGLAAAIVILGGSVALQLLYLGWQMGPFMRAQLLGVQHGWAQFGAYVGVTALACLGYGAFFLVAGLFTRNPIIPVAVLLIWEGINPFLPALLKHVSIIYYLIGLLPVRLASGPGTNSLIKLLATSGNALAPGWDVLGVIVAAALLLWLASWRVRRLEIDYASD